jgi:hypothetical protein
MGSARLFPNAVILPDASILVFGGQSNPAPGASPVLQVERYAGGTSWETLAAASSPRDYHSGAVLLPDGRVLVAGGDHRRNLANPPTFEPCDYEIFVPSYLTDPTKHRPEFVPAPPELTVSFGSESPALPYKTDSGVTIAKVVLMRPGSTTHHSDFDQRYVQLDFELHDNSTLSFTAPPGWPGPTRVGTNAAPPGWYMLFLVSSQGVPSLAGWVRLQ